MLEISISQFLKPFFDSKYIAVTCNRDSYGFIGNIEGISLLNQSLFVSNFDICSMEKNYCQITQDY
jgi:hypothetical protein